MKHQGASGASKPFFIQSLRQLPMYCNNALFMSPFGEQARLAKSCNSEVAISRSPLRACSMASKYQASRSWVCSVCSVWSGLGIVLMGAPSRWP